MNDEQKTKKELLNEIHSLQEEIKHLKQELNNPGHLTAAQETNLLQNSRILESILDNSLPIIFLIDKHGTFTVSEGKDLQTLGLTPGQVVGQSAYEIYKDYPEIINAIKKALTGQHCREEIHVEGQVFDVFYSPYYDEHGHIPGIVGMGINVTERVLALKELRLLTEIVEQSTDSIIYTDPEFRITYVNNATEELFGWSLQELQGKTPALLNAEPFSDEFQQKIYATISKREAFSGEALNRRKDGSTFYCEMKISAITDSDDNITGYMSLQRDITQRLQNEAQMQLQSMALNAAANGIMITDTEGTVIWVNPALSTLTGYPPAEVIGKKPSILNSGTHPADFFKQLWETISSGKVWEGQITNRRKDGQQYIDEQTITPVFDNSGQITHYIAIKQDISERIRAEEKLKRKLTESSIMKRISMAGAALIDEDVLIETITGVISSSFYSDHLGVLLIDETEGYLYPHPSYIGINEEDFSKKVGIGQGVSGKVAEMGKPLLISDVSNFPEYISTLSGLRSEICVPLVVSEKLIGIINVESKELNAFSQEDLQLLTTISSQLATAIERTRLYKELIHSNQELSVAYDRTLEGWASALELRDHETQGHTERVTQLAVTLAQETGMQEPELTQLRRGSLLHDIGKIGIPDSILFKPGPLSEMEIAVMQQHPVYAKNLLARIPFLKPALEIPYYHHEKWDGTGYPVGLKGEDIPLAARIFAIADVFDALTSSRPYRAAWGKQEALNYIVFQSGKHFDSRLVDVFTRLVELD